MFTVHSDYSVDQPLSQFYASQMINQEWLQADGTNQIFAAASDITDGAAHSLITAYASKREDGRWSVMLVNRDQDNGHHVALEFTQGAGAPAHFARSIDVAIFGREQYAWHPSQRSFNAHAPQSGDEGPEIYKGGNASPDGPIVRRRVTAEGGFDVPPASVMVLNGVLQP
jgi:hypothetical protein